MGMGGGVTGCLGVHRVRICCVVGPLCCTGTVGLGFSAWAFLLHRSDHVELAKCCHSKQGDGHCVSAALWPQDCTACCQVAALSCLLVFATGGFIAVVVPCKATLPLLLSVWVAVARLLRVALSVVCLGCTQSVQRLFVRLQWMGYSWTPFLLCVVWVCVLLLPGCVSRCLQPVLVWWVCCRVVAAAMQSGRYFMLMLQADCLLPRVLLKQCLRHVCNCWLGACSIRSSGSATLFCFVPGGGTAIGWPHTAHSGALPTA